MHWKAIFPSEHLESADIPPGGTMTLRIEGIEHTRVEGDKKGETKDKAMITFTALDPWARDFPKHTWIAPKTVCACIGAMFGDDINGWVGKRVAVCVERVDAFGEQVDAVRVAGSPDIQKRITGKVRKGRTKATVTLMPTTDPAQHVPAQRSPEADLRSQLAESLRANVTDSGWTEDQVRAACEESGLCSEQWVEKLCAKLFPKEVQG